MPWRFGWKHEYRDGHAHLTPRQDHVHLRLALRETRAPAIAPTSLSVRRVQPTDVQALVRAFIETFVDGMEFCDWPVQKVHEHASRNIYRLLRRTARSPAPTRLAPGG